MKKGKQDGKKQAGGPLYVAGTPFTDLKPEEITTEPRVGNPCTAVEPVEDFIEIANDVKYQAFQEDMAWPGDEVALEHDFGVDVPQKDVEFTPCDDFKLPETYCGSHNHIVFYKRAHLYLKQTHVAQQVTKDQLE